LALKSWDWEIWSQIYWIIWEDWQSCTIRVMLTNNLVFFVYDSLWKIKTFAFFARYASRDTCLMNSFFSLEKLFLQKNQLILVPSSLFRIKSLVKVNLSHNMITTLDDDESLDMGDTWRCPSLKVLKLNHNSLTALPRGISSATGLMKLFVNNNKLKDFPMPWKCPLVRK